jgi:hypothetical protein
MNVLQNGVCNSTFERDYVHYADLLLSGSSPQSPAFPFDSSYEAAIMCRLMLVIPSIHCIPPSIFLQLFQAITVFLPAFYSASRINFTRFVSEWSARFATNYLHAIFERFFS